MSERGEGGLIIRRIVLITGRWAYHSRGGELTRMSERPYKRQFIVNQIKYQVNLWQ